MAVLNLWYMIMLICGGYGVSQAVTSTWVDNTDSSLGPVINVLCEFYGSFISITFTWELNDTTLASNDRLSANADSTRYNVTVGDVSNRAYGSLLQIRNALKQDAGVYTCRVRVTTQREDGSTQSFNQPQSSTTVAINQYLPPPGYPKCIIYPSTTLIEHTDATFSCVSGDASPPMNIRLSLQKQNGIYVELGNTNQTKQVTVDDNNTVFVCTMTSDTFPTAPQLSCSADPISIQKKPSTTVFPIVIPACTQQPKEPTDPKGTMSMYETTPETKSSSAIGSHFNPYVSGIIGGIIGAFVTAGIFIIIITVYRHHTNSKPSDKNITMTTSSKQPASSSTDSTYMAYNKGNEQEQYTELQKSTVVVSSPDYQNMHNYESNIQIHKNC